jgi:hypothetical protein
MLFEIAVFVIALACLPMAFRVVGSMWAWIDEASDATRAFCLAVGDVVAVSAWWLARSVWAKLRGRQPISYAAHIAAIHRARWGPGTPQHERYQEARRALGV